MNDLLMIQSDAEQADIDQHCFDGAIMLRPDYSWTGCLVKVIAQYDAVKYLLACLSTLGIMD